MLLEEVDNGERARDNLGDNITVREECPEIVCFPGISVTVRDRILH